MVLMQKCCHPKGKEGVEFPDQASAEEERGGVDMDGRFWLLQDCIVRCL